jgi:hypothetical protein
MDTVHIDRLTLDVPGLSEPEGMRLASLVAERLAAGELPAEAAPGGVLRVEVAGGAGGAGGTGDLRALAQQIAAAIARRWARVG